MKKGKVIINLIVIISIWLGIFASGLWYGTKVYGEYVEELKREIIEIKNFSSIYYAASRFLRYLTLVEGEKDSFVNEINNMFAKIPIAENSGDFGIQKLYVLRKK